MKKLNFVPDNATDCIVTAWLHTETSLPRPSIIICPGGAYEYISPREADPVAEKYFSAGYNTFILNYSVKEDAKNFKPLKQLAATIVHLRKNSKQFFVDEEKIAVCGFSAGGHLAGSLGTIANTKSFKKLFKFGGDTNPSAMILCYPVISTEKYIAHVKSIKNVSGNEDGTKEYKFFSLDRHVTKKTPPTFLWHTSQDEGVPCQNSLKLANAFAKKGIPFELHIFPHGPHGMSVCTKEVGTEDEYNGRWLEWSVLWLNKLFNL